MAVQTPRIMSTSSRVRPAGKQVPHARHQLLGVDGVQETYLDQRRFPMSQEGLHRFAGGRFRAARGFLRGRDGQQGRALVDQQRVAQFPGGQLQRLGHVQRAVLGIGRMWQMRWHSAIWALVSPDFSVPSTMAATPSAACPRCAQARSAAWRMSQGGGPGRAPAPSARRPASPGPAPLPAWRRRGRSPARRRRRWTGPRPPGAGSRPRYGGHQHQFREPHGLDRPGGRADVAGVAGVHHDETDAGKHRRRAGFGGAETPSEEGDLPSRDGSPMKFS